jgi:hypothetical protein
MALLLICNLGGFLLMLITSINQYRTIGNMRLALWWLAFVFIPFFIQIGLNAALVASVARLVIGAGFMWY